MNQVIAHAPAKINLSLEVAPLRAGEEKHRLSSVFCTTTLCDTLVFDFVSGKEPFNAQVTIKSAGSKQVFVKEGDNTLIRIVEHFKRAYGFGFLPSGTLHVQLIKSIPTQAGLGGGSSDAAAMLRMLCWLAQVEPLSEKSLSVARAVGADVPFFLHAPKEGLCAHMGGYGDELIEVLPKPELHLVLVKPNRGVSTKQAYKVFDEEVAKVASAAFGGSTYLEGSAVPGGGAATKQLIAALTAKETANIIVHLCSNNLEPAAVSLLPIIGTLKDELAIFSGVSGATMSGSGSAIFAICQSAQATQACMQHFADQGLWAVAIQT
ncbi:MAG: hypothetical protein FWD27_07995 [Coriobacteriia bacterium]|nr:hypothetical protein [Coriobacteriia bacterium]